MNNLPVGQHSVDSIMVRRIVSKTNGACSHVVEDLSCVAAMELDTTSFGKLLNETPERPEIDVRSKLNC